MPIRSPRIPEQVREAIRRISLNEFLQAGKELIHINGLDPTFSKNLEAMFRGMPSSIRAEIFSGYRSPERQRQLWENAVKKYGSPAAARRWVAPPGHSFHNKGFAADLKYLSPEAKKWVHDNAKNYGLYFPLSNEPWHIEQIGTRTGKITSQTGSVVRRGSAPEAVSALQSALAGAGFNPGAIDGKFGGRTDAAVRAFQKANGLKIDGVAGPRTQAALNNYQGTRAALAYGNAYGNQSKFQPQMARPELRASGMPATRQVAGKYDPLSSINPSLKESQWRYNPLSSIQTTKPAAQPQVPISNMVREAGRRLAAQSLSGPFVPGVTPKPVSTVSVPYQQQQTAQSIYADPRAAALSSFKPTPKLNSPAPMMLSKQGQPIDPKRVPTTTISYGQPSVSASNLAREAGRRKVAQSLSGPFVPGVTPKPVQTTTIKYNTPQTYNPLSSIQVPSIPRPVIAPQQPVSPQVVQQQPVEQPSLFGTIMNNLPSLSTVKQGIQKVGQAAVNTAVSTYMANGPVKLAQIAGQAGPQAYWSQFNNAPGSPVNVAAASYQAAKMFMQPRNERGQFMSPQSYESNKSSGGNFKSGGSNWNSSSPNQYTGPSGGGWSKKSGGG